MALELCTERCCCHPKFKRNASHQKQCQHRSNSPPAPGAAARSQELTRELVHTQTGVGSPCTGVTWQRGTGTVPSLWGCQMRLGALASQPPFFSLPSFPLGTTGDTRLVPRLGLKAMGVICQRRATKRETVAWVSSLCAALLAL